MSTPDQPNGPGLTRKQMREIRMTGATPIIDPDAAAAASAPETLAVPAEPPAAAPATEAAAPEPAVPSPAAESPAPASPVVPPVPVAPAAVDVPAPPAHLPRAAEPIIAAPAPIPDAQVDLGVSPLTRRQAREQERIRTASVPVITPDIAAAHTAASGWAPAIPVAPSPPAAEAPEAAIVEAEIIEEPAPADPTAGEDEHVPTITQLFDAPDTAAEPAGSSASAEEESAAAAEIEPAEVVEAVVEEPAPVPVAAVGGGVSAPAAEDDTEETAEASPVAAADEKPVLRPEFGAALFEGAAPGSPLAPSFDELIARGASSNGSSGTPNALILTQSPASAPLTAPVAATGEVLITGMLALPDGLGSQGHATGTTDGHEADAVLIDGELPPASSPTPIAASAAISTVKGTGEIIRPPAPEKGSKLMLSLAITAGVLAVALVGVLIVAFVTGVFS